MEEENKCSSSSDDHHIQTQESYVDFDNASRGGGDSVSSNGGHGKGGGLSFLKSMFFNHNTNRKSSFRRRIIKGMVEEGEEESKGNNDSNIDSASGKGGWSLPISHLSPVAYNVISRCCKIIHASAEDLYHSFDKDLPDKVKQPSTCARNFIEFCSYQAIHLSVTRPDYLSNKEFRRLLFDMMLAWESSGVDSDLLVNEISGDKNPEEDEDGWSLFYSSSTNTAVQVDDKNTVGQEAFTRIAPACFIVADIITVHNLFDVLTRSSSHRLHFLIFDKYLRSLEKVIKAVNNGIGAQFFSSIPLVEQEIILDVDGTVPTQPVLQHIGISAWPGRLTLTNYALYFEPGIGIYDKAVRYDLATDSKQVIKPELTGPLGVRLFDKAVMYKSTSYTEPVYFEFPEFKSSSRRDYWLDICLEILRAHRFIRKYNLRENQVNEALARGILGIFRYHAIREAFHAFPSNFRTLLCYNLAESLPGGDMILKTLSNRLAMMKYSGRHDTHGSPNMKKQTALPFSLLTLRTLGILSCNEEDFNIEGTFHLGEYSAGEISPLEAAVKESKHNIGRAVAAQATVDQVKVEGIDTNLAVLKELLYPLIESFDRLQRLVSWEEPWKSVLFLLLISYTIFRGWTRYILPCIFLSVAGFMIWRKQTSQTGPLEAFKIVAPPTKNAVEQLLTLQDAVTQVEGLIQSVNIVLLKLRALLYAVIPQATEKVAVMLFVVALALAFVPLNYIILSGFVESFTRNMPLRKESSARLMRRTREWWLRIPAAPVELIKPDDKKRR